MATKTKSKTSKSKRTKQSKVQEKAALDFDFSAQFDAAEKSAKLSSVEVTENLDLSTVIHSGSLVLDLVILGGGYQAGRIYDLQGKESGGKTTLAKMAMTQAIKSIPNKTKGIYGDAEGTLDKKWFKNILELYGINTPLKEIFGERDKEGNWLHKPVIRLIKPTTGDDYLILIIKYLNNLPDKVFHDEKWWYRWTPVEAKTAKKTGGLMEKNIREMFKQNGWTPNAKMLKTTGSFMVEVPNNYGGPELLIVTDSMIALIPRQTAEDDSAAMAPHGRMFSKYLNNIKGLIARKGVTMLNINQLRDKPGTTYGDPTYSPGGNTLHFAGDCRFRINPCANPRGKGQIEEEGNDKYRWTDIKNTKNKLFTPYGKFKLRWWVQRDGAIGCGIDPILDTMEYLELTNQIKEVGRKGFNIILESKNKRAKALANVLFTEDTFKDFVLQNSIVLDKKSEPIAFNLRNFCVSQIRSGTARKLYSATPTTVVSNDIELDEED